MPRSLPLDCLKAFTIYCVLLGHTITWTLRGDPYHDSALFVFIYSFHMPLFMLLSGWFMGRSFELGWRDFIAKRSRQLLLPVISFFSLFFLVYNGLLSPWLGIEPAPILPTIFGGDMWFLKYLFLMSLLLYTLKKGLRHELAILGVILVLFCLTRSGIFRLLPYLWLGHFLQSHWGWIARHQRRLLTASALLFFGMLTLWQGDYDAHLRFIYFQPSLSIHGEHLYASLVRLGVGIGGSLFFLLLTSELAPMLERLPGARYLAGIGQHTLGIYCLQIYLIEYFCERCIPLKLAGGSADLLRLGLAGIFLLVCLLLTLLLQRNRWTALLFLGKK